jgi:hypothetical protein
MIGLPFTKRVQDFIYFLQTIDLCPTETSTGTVMISANALTARYGEKKGEKDETLKSRIGYYHELFTTSKLWTYRDARKSLRYYYDIQAGRSGGHRLGSGAN